MKVTCHATCQYTIIASTLLDDLAFSLAGSFSCPVTVYLSLVNMYKTMGGGWVLQAEEVANKAEAGAKKWPLSRPMIRKRNDDWPRGC